MTVAELHTDTNNSAETQGNGSNHSNKISERNHSIRGTILVEGQSSRSNKNADVSRGDETEPKLQESGQGLVKRHKRNANSYQ